MNPPETIDAGPVLLQRWKTARAEELTGAVRESLPELIPFLPWAHEGYALVDARGYLELSEIEWAKGKEFNYALVTIDGELAGSIGLMTRMGPGILEIGYWTRTPFAGRGLMTAAVEAVTKVALSLPGIDRVAIRYDPANGASAAVAAKAGFREVRRLPSDINAPGQTGVEVVAERSAR